MYVRDSVLNPTTRWIRLAKIGLLLSLALLIPAFGLPQPVTGPLVNALLILAVESTGIGAAMLAGMITPLNALLHGVLPLPLMVMIPFIALSNAVLVGLYGALRRTNYWLALGVAAVAKFGLLYAAVTWLLVRPLSISMGGTATAMTLPAAIANAMQWPQLATALAGGVIAYAALAGYRRLTRKD